MNRREFSATLIATTLGGGALPLTASAQTPTEGAQYAKIEPPVPPAVQGKIEVVEFFSYACPHCAAFSKILEEASTKYAGKVSFLSIVNPPDTPDKVGAFTTANKISLPILFDCG